MVLPPSTVESLHVFLLNGPNMTIMEALIKLLRASIKVFLQVFLRGKGLTINEFLTEI